MRASFTIIHCCQYASHSLCVCCDSISILHWMHRICVKLYDTIRSGTLRDFFHVGFLHITRHAGLMQWLNLWVQMQAHHKQKMKFFSFGEFSSPRACAIVFPRRAIPFESSWKSNSFTQNWYSIEMRLAFEYIHVVYDCIMFHSSLLCLVGISPLHIPSVCSLLHGFPCTMHTNIRSNHNNCVVLSLNLN